MTSDFPLVPGKASKKFSHMALVGRRGSAWVDRSFLTTNSGYFIEVSFKMFGYIVVGLALGFIMHIFRASNSLIGKSYIVCPEGRGQVGAPVARRLQVFSHKYRNFRGMEEDQLISR